MNFGEKIPNTIQIHLPPCSTKTHVYETMVLESHMESLPFSFLEIIEGRGPTLIHPKGTFAFYFNHERMFHRNNKFSNINYLIGKITKLGFFFWYRTIVFPSTTLAR